MCVGLQLEDVFSSVLPKILNADASIISGYYDHHRLLQVNVVNPPEKEHSAHSLRVHKPRLEAVGEAILVD